MSVSCELIPTPSRPCSFTHQVRQCKGERALVLPSSASNNWKGETTLKLPRGVAKETGLAGPCCGGSQCAAPWPQRGERVSSERGVLLQPCKKTMPLKAELIRQGWRSLPPTLAEKPVGTACTSKPLGSATQTLLFSSSSNITYND